MEDLSSEWAIALGDGAGPRPRASAPAAPAARRRRLLVVGGDPALAHGLAAGLERRGYGVHQARDAASAWIAWQRDPADGLVLDLECASASGGVRLLRQIRQADATVPLVAVARPTSPRAGAVADAIDAGAFVLAPPVAPDAVHAVFERALGERRRAGALAYYRMREARDAGLGRLLGESIPMLRLKTQLRLLLDDEAHRGRAGALLLHGQSGTGKREAARALHFDGARRDRPFVQVDVEDLSGPEAERRLFGGEHGAGVGLPGRRCEGLVAAADGGTLFIGELGALALPLQGRVARLLEHGVLQRLGGVREVPVDVRVIAATRCTPETLLRTGRLHLGLHRRLGGTPLQLTPLRERDDDLWLLAHRFIERTAQRQGIAPPQLSGSACELLARHPWPGNVRELRHALERAVLLQAEGTIDASHLALGTAPQPAPVPPPMPPELNLQRLEREALAQALVRTYGNVSQAARLLGISRDTMRYRIARHALDGPRAMR